MKTLVPISHTLHELATGKVTSSDLVESCLNSIADVHGEGSRTFTRVYTTSAKTVAKNFDVLRPAGPLAGLPVSIKDLFDVEGQPTPAGSVVLADAKPAAQDSTVVRRLREAGAVLVGRTNMTEFAYSGLGINPHYGTPLNPYERTRARIPGGSSSGAAVSVTDGMAYAGIGSDTGGSVRIPAALCGLTGFKPTARRVPMDGMVPLSTSLDSVGPLAPTVACCALLDAVLAGEAPREIQTVEVKGLRLAVLQGYVLEGLESHVASAFSAALELLSQHGATVSDFVFTSLDAIPEANQKGGLAGAESYAWHHRLMDESVFRYDPHVASRILRGSHMTATDYVEVLQARRRIIADAEQAFTGFDAILLPTTPRIAPYLADLEASDEAYFDANGAVLRNPSVFNFLDGCALSIPCHLPGEAPVGLMVAGLGGWDEKILRIGAAIEGVLAAAGRAIHGSPQMSHA